MGLTASHLSDASFGYDFVVATTEASINSSLLEWLSQAPEQPPSYICFTGAGDTLTQISLEQLLSLTGGVNPFDVPAQTPMSDPRIAALNKANFAGGIRMQVGLPLGVLPKDLPMPVIGLGVSAANIVFNMYCSQLSVVQNTPSVNASDPGSWGVWTQAPGQAWPLRTLAGLVANPLDRALDAPYFRGQGAPHKAALLAKLSSLDATGSAFSLQQLLFDLPNARMDGPLLLWPSDCPRTLLNRCFIPTYAASVEQQGSPILSVKAVAPGPNPSGLALTGLEWMVSPWIKETDPLSLAFQPTPASTTVLQEEAATTLNYLCAVDGHVLPPAVSFTWNWVEPQLVDSESGVVAINRNLIAGHILQQLLPFARPMCTKLVFTLAPDSVGQGTSWHWKLYPGQEPDSAIVTDSGTDVVKISYAPTYPPHQEISGAAGAIITIKPSYTCTVNFAGTTITVTQHLVMNVVAIISTGSGSTSFMGVDTMSSANVQTINVNIVDSTLTDAYDLAVSQDGALQMTQRAGSAPVNLGPDPTDSKFLSMFGGLEGFTEDVKANASTITATQLHSIPFAQLQSFVFPAAKVFAFKSAGFSYHQDLVCAITYVDPTPSPAPVPPTQPVVAPPFPEPVVPTPVPVVPTPIPVVPTSIVPGVVPPPVGPTPVIPTPVTPATTDYKLTYSSQLLQNYIQGEAVSPQGKFEAVQTADGHTLLFAISSAGALSVVAESSGTSRTGWVQTDLSTAIIQATFPSAKVSTFDVGQSAVDGTIGLAMAISSAGSDNLFISLSNANVSNAWLTSPAWLDCRFDAPEGAPSLSIDSIFFSETSNSQQYLIVDIDRSRDPTVKEIARYYIDPSKAGGSYWVPHDVPVDIEKGDYQSCVGRPARAYVDGVYTMGKAGASAQLVYVPLVNAFGSGPPMPTRLALPGGTAASAIAAARNDDPSSSLHGTTDLYAVGGLEFYLFTAEDQIGDGAVGRLLLSNPIFAGTSQLTAMTSAGVTTIWGRNGNNQVYYLSCATSHITMAGAWSVPIPILVGAEHITAYVNRRDGGNTIFTAGGGSLQKIYQATDTSSKMWRTQTITLQAPPKQACMSFKSYTTSLQLTDANNIQAPGAIVAISAQSRAPVYINGLYYTLGPLPVNVATSNTGSLTIMEALTSLTGTVLTVSVRGAAAAQASINPMEATFDKLATLNTKVALRSATIPKNYTAGGVLGEAQPGPLVPPSTSDDDVSSAASNIGALKQVYDDVNSPAAAPSPPVAAARVALAATAVARFSLPGFPDAIAAASGDVIQWTNSTYHSVVQSGGSTFNSGVDGLSSGYDIVKDASSGAWHVVTTIAGQVYHAILDSVEAVVGAAEFVFNTIKTAIEDVLVWLEFLMVWNDIKRTKEVLNSLTSLYLQEMVSVVQQIQPVFDSKIASIESDINQWAGIKGWAPLGSGPAVTPPSNPTQGQTPASQLLAGHFQDNASMLSIEGDLPGGGGGLDVAQEILDDLMTAVSNEGAVLAAFFDQLQGLASEIGPSMNVGDLLKQLVGLLGDVVLSSAQVVVDCLLKVLCDLSSAAVGLLSVNIHIPVLSDILNALGIPDISFLDLFCWVTGAAYTIVYMVLNGGTAPFADDNQANRVTTAQDWSSVMALFHPASTAPQASASLSSSSKEAVRVSSFAAAPAPAPAPAIRDAAPQSGSTDSPDQGIDWSRKIFYMGHAGAAIALGWNAWTQADEAMFPTGDNPLSFALTVVTGLAQISRTIANIVDLKEPTNDATKYTSIGTSAATTLARFVFSNFFMSIVRRKGPSGNQVAPNDTSGPPNSNVPKTETIFDDPRKFSGIVNAILVVPALYCTIRHFMELTEPGLDYDPAPALCDEVSSCCNYVSRLSYNTAVNLSEDKKVIPLYVLKGANLGVVACQVILTLPSLL